MQARIVRLPLKLPPGTGPIYQLETRPLPELRWHASSEGPHTSPDPQTLRAVAEREGWELFLPVPQP